MERNFKSSRKILDIFNIRQQPTMQNLTTHRSYSNYEQHNPSINNNIQNKQNISNYPSQEYQNYYNAPQQLSKQFTNNNKETRHISENKLIKNNINPNQKSKKKLNVSILTSKPMIKAQKYEENNIFQNLCLNIDQYSRNNKSRTAIEYVEIVFDCHPKRQERRIINNRSTTNVNTDKQNNYSDNRKKRNSKLSLYKDISLENTMNGHHKSTNQLITCIQSQYYDDNQIFSFGKINIQDSNVKTTAIVNSSSDNNLYYSNKNQRLTSNCQESTSTKEQPSFKKHKLSFTNYFQSEITNQSQLKISETQQKYFLLNDSYDTQIDILNSEEKIDSLRQFFH